MDLPSGPYGCPARCRDMVVGFVGPAGILDFDFTKCLSFQEHAKLAWTAATKLIGFTIQHINIMATIRILLGIICFAAVSGYRVSHRNLLSADAKARAHLLNIARREIGVREKSGQNDGEQVERYLAAAGLKKGQPWCAAFISWVFKEGGYAAPRTAWSPALFNTRVNTKELEPCNVFGIWFPTLKRIAHVGLAEKRDGDWLISIEGNTNSAGSRAGDGVYRKRRPVRTIYVIADWLKGKGDSHE